MIRRLFPVVCAPVVVLALSQCSNKATVPSSAPIPIDEHGVEGTLNSVGCGDGLWKHVHTPERLTIRNNCVTVTGVIMDSTVTQPIRQADAVRHEPDGDTHGWLKVDPQFASLLNDGNMSDQRGNLVFEIVCHYVPTQADSLTSCVNFVDTQRIPPVGTHVAITGTFVQDTNHARWNEIHPVSSIKVQ